MNIYLFFALKKCAAAFKLYDIPLVNLVDFLLTFHFNKYFFLLTPIDFFFILEVL
jgi:hypothetical protein